MKEIQDYLQKFQKEMNWDISTESYEASRTSILNNFMLFTTEVGEVGEEFRAIFNETNRLMLEEKFNEEEAFNIAKEKYKDNIGKEIADCFAYLVKFANYLGIDLEASFYGKMEEIKQRENKDK